MCICDKQYHSFDRAINIKDLNIRYRMKLRKKLYPPFLWMGFKYLKATEPLL